jgi:hypothetical protein
MNTFFAAVRRACRVAFSRQAQPGWFRTVKWTCLLAGVALFHDRPGSWWTLAALALAGLWVHFLYRRKIKIWTRAWGGWNDPDAGRD